MDDLARELSISKKTIYQFFSNKDELVQKVIFHHMERDFKRVADLVSQSKDAIDEMFLIAKLYVEQIELISQSTVYDLQKYYKRLWDEVLEKQDKHDIACISKNIKRGQREGFYRKNIEADIIAKMFTKLTLVVLNEMANKNSQHSRKKLVKELHDYHMRSLTNEVGLAKWKKQLKSI